MIDSAVLGEKRRINVYLPAGTPSGMALPVMYMPDGGMLEDFLHVAGLLQVGAGNMTTRPFLLVGIENTERRRDLTGPTENAKDRSIAPRVGGSRAFRNFIRNELMPGYIGATMSVSTSSPACSKEMGREGSRCLSQVYAS